MNEDVTLVVMAAGLGSRYNGSKQLELFGSRQLTLAEYNIEHAITCGINDVVLVINEKYADIFDKRLRDFLPSSCDFKLVYQEPESALCKYGYREKPWGTGHAIKCCDGVVNNNFCVINADDLYGYDAIFNAVRFLKSTDAKSMIFGNVVYKLSGTMSPNGAVSRGVIITDDALNISKINEVHNITCDNVHELGLSVNDFVSMNLWCFTPCIFKLLQDGWKYFCANLKDPLSDEFGLSSFVGDCIQQKKCTVKAIPTTSTWYGVTYRDDKKILDDVLQ